MDIEEDGKKRPVIIQVTKQGLVFTFQLLKTRMEIAQDLLLNSDISKLIGYCELSDFSHAFKRFLNLFPEDWKTQNLK